MQGQKTGGRQKGTPNKTTAMMKSAIEDVFTKLQDKAGGENAHFLGWATENPTEFYKLSAKLLPIQLAGEIGVNVGIGERIIRARRRHAGLENEEETDGAE